MLRRTTRLLVAAAVLALPAAAAAQSTDDSLDLAILDVLKARGLINDAEYAELQQLAQQRVDAHANEVALIEASLQRLQAPDVMVRGGQPGKLDFRSADGKWSMNIKGKMQVRAENDNSDADTGDGTNFSVPRAYVGFEGKAGAENVTYKLEFDIPTQSSFTSSSTTKNSSLRDGYINWAFGPLAALRFGQFKVPFGREELISSWGLSLIERSIASTEFAPSYEPGAMLHGILGDGMFEYYADISNGQGPGASNAAGEDRNGLRKSARIVWNVNDVPLKAEGMSFSTVDDGSTKAAIGASFMQNDDSTGKTTVTPGAQTNTSGIDAQVFSGPWSLLAELYDRNANLNNADGMHDSGDTFQVGYFLVPNRWEVVARSSHINYESADDKNEYSAGVNYYVDKNNGKWQLDYSKLDNDGSTPDQDRIRLQYQIQF